MVAIDPAYTMEVDEMAAKFDDTGTMAGHITIVAPWCNKSFEGNLEEYVG